MEMCTGTILQKRGPTARNVVSSLAAVPFLSIIAFFIDIDQQHIFRSRIEWKNKTKEQSVTCSLILPTLASS